MTLPQLPKPPSTGVLQNVSPLLGSCSWIKPACALDWGGKCATSGSPGILPFSPFLKHSGLITRQHIQVPWFQPLLHSLTLMQNSTLFSNWLHALAKNTRWRRKGLPSKPSNLKFDDRPARRKNHPICPEKLPLGYTLPSGGVPCSKSLRVPC